MSTTPQEAQDDWRAQALRNMEQADEPILEHKREGGRLGVVLVKVTLLIVLSVALVYFVGWGFLAAPAFAAWLLFWPR